MITQIDWLRVPPTTEGTAELFNRDAQRRTVSGRLITKLDPAEKWRLTTHYPAEALDAKLQSDFYNVCRIAREEPVPITFISPYDGEEHTIWARCVSRATPSAFNLVNRRPQYYVKVGAVFEEI